MTKENSALMVGYADLPGSGPRGWKCKECVHFLDYYSYRSGRLLDTGVCLKKLEFMGQCEGAIMARTGDIRAAFAARATLPKIKRTSPACCEFQVRKNRAA